MKARLLERKRGGAIGETHGRKAEDAYVACSETGVQSHIYSAPDVADVDIAGKFRIIIICLMCYGCGAQSRQKFFKLLLLKMPRQYDIQCAVALREGSECASTMCRG